MSSDSTETLELSHFIRDTLVEIVTGVEEAQEEIEEIETNAEVCPTGLHFKGESPGPFKPGRGFVQEVEFDVAITVSESRSQEEKGKGALNIGVPPMQWLGGIEAGGEMGSSRTKERSDVSHVTFKVPVLLPSEVYPWDD